MAINQQTGLTFRVTPTQNGDISELGPAGSGGQVSTLVVQFEPSLDWVGSFVVMGKAYGKAAADKGATFVPVPYRRVNVGNFAADYLLVSDAITDTAIIQVPANGLSIGLLQACSAGYMDIIMWRLDGSSAV